MAAVAPSIEASVVIAARDAAATLPRTLAALARQEVSAEYEVVVVDDGSCDRTAEVARSAPGPVRVVSQPRASGPAAARNRGVAAARGGILAFTDADCFPTRTWLASGLRALQSADLVQGAVHADPEAPLRAFHRTVWVTSETGRYELANIFVRREWFERVGGLEAWLTPEIGKELAEDLWLAWRVRRAGGRVAFCQEALVHHAVFYRGVREFLAERRRLRYFPAIVRKVPEIRETMFFAHWFLSRRTAAFDAGVLGGLLALMVRSRVPLLAVLPYAWLVVRIRRPWRPAGAGIAVVELIADTIGLAELIHGSIRRRALVL